MTELKSCLCGGKAEINQYTDPAYNYDDWVSTVYWYSCELCRKKTKAYYRLGYAKRAWNKINS